MAPCLSFFVMLLVGAQLGQLALVAGDCCSDMPAVIGDLQAQIDGLQNNVAGLQSEVKALKAPVAAKCPAGFTYIATVKKCYNMVVNQVAWSTALSMCASLGGNLATVMSQAENDAIVNYVRVQGSSATTGCANGIWIAAQRADTTCSTGFVWKSSDGSVTNLSYSNWYLAPQAPKTQPDCQGGSESCAHYWPNLSWGYPAMTGWNDIPCSTLLCPLCQI